MLDLACAPLSAVSLLWLGSMRRLGNAKLPIHRKLYRKVGVYPTIDHYYDPFLKRGDRPTRQDWNLPGLDWNVKAQLDLLKQFRWQAELAAFATTPASPPTFSYDNPAFGVGDAEILYSMIRHFKPRRMVEIGSGSSTLIAVAALAANRAENPAYECDHACIEPFECPWLSSLPVRLIRQRAETVEPSLFSDLRAGDVLFVDSSHVIRPGGDVLFEILEVIPSLQKGVVIHVHDIFSPRDYPDAWMSDEIRLWNEQYLLEAFLSHNCDFSIISALNFLFHHHRAALREACPMLDASVTRREPASFWFMRH